MAVPARPHGLVKPMLALAVGTVMSLGLAEVVLRIHNPIRVPLRANHIVLPINNNFRYQTLANEKTDPIVESHYNGLGMRGPDKPRDFARKLTLVTVGGSTTVCQDLTDIHTWPHLVYEKLHAERGDFWLNNAGLDGHSTFGHLMLLRQYLAALKPRYILYLIGANDVGRKDINVFDYTLTTKSMSFRNKIVAASELLSTIQVLTRTMRAIELGVRSRPDMNFLVTPHLRTSDAEVARILQEHQQIYLPRYRERLIALMDETAAAGIQPIVATQPALYGEVRDPTLGIEIGGLQFEGGIDARLQGRVLALYNDVTRAEAARRKVPLIDLARSMPKDSRYYFDWIHYSVEGAAKVADLVVEGLRRVLPEK
jgi:lysophospholipase L1-like esterase